MSRMGAPTKNSMQQAARGLLTGMQAVQVTYSHVEGIWLVHAGADVVQVKIGRDALGQRLKYLPRLLLD